MEEQKHERRKRHFRRMPLGSARANDKSIIYMDVEAAKEEVEKKRKEILSSIKTQPNIFVQTLSRISKSPNVSINRHMGEFTHSLTDKEIKLVNVYTEMCQILSDRYTGAKLRSLVMWKQAFPGKPILKPKIRETSKMNTEEMWESDIDSSERNRHFNQEYKYIR